MAAAAGTVTCVTSLGVMKITGDVVTDGTYPARGGVEDSPRNPTKGRHQVAEKKIAPAKPAAAKAEKTGSKAAATRVTKKRSYKRRGYK